VAHVSNDAVDVIDVAAQKYIGSIGDLTAVAGVLVARDLDIVTSDRGESTLAWFGPDDCAVIGRIGSAFGRMASRTIPTRAAPRRACRDPAIPGSTTASIVDVHARKRLTDIPVARRPRWTVYDPVADAFHVNIADPPQIVVVEAGDPVGIRCVVPVAHAGPHGLDLDPMRRRLFCACYAGVVLEVHADGGAILGAEAIAGVPDVVFLDAALGRLYVAIGDPGVIGVFDTMPLRRHETVPTERGATRCPSTPRGTSSAHSCPRLIAPRCTRTRARRSASGRPFGGGRLVSSASGSGPRWSAGRGRLVAG
jgi:hypothetical protein